MSGGSYNYAYWKMEEFCDQLAGRATTPQRKAFLDLCHKVCVAMKAIEWVDSSDSSPGDENAAIESCFQEPQAACLKAIINEAKAVTVQLERLVKENE